MASTQFLNSSVSSEALRMLRLQCGSRHSALCKLAFSCAPSYSCRDKEVHVHAVPPDRLSLHTAGPMPTSHYCLLCYSPAFSRCHIRSALFARLLAQHCQLEYGSALAYDRDAAPRPSEGLLMIVCMHPLSKLREQFLHIQVDLGSDLHHWTADLHSSPEAS